MTTVAQRPLGKEFDSTGGKIGFVVFADPGDDEEAVRTAVLDEAPSSFLGFAITGVRAAEIASDGEGGGEPLIWDAEVSYGTAGGRLAPPATGTTVWTGTTSGGTQHISSGRGVADVFTDPTVSSLPFDWGQTIGATKDSIEGVDITIPVFTFKATKYVTAAEFATLLPNLHTVTGTVNDASWSANGMTFAAGEVLFMGATWAKRVEVEPNDYEVTFEFAAQPSADDITIGDITGIAKAGWDYLDITYEDREDSGFLYKKPIIATIHQVYLRTDFDSLGL